MRGLAYGVDHLLARIDQTVIVVVVWIAIAVIAIGLTVSCVLS
jgi:hypothetical protein